MLGRAIHHKPTGDPLAPLEYRGHTVEPGSGQKVGEGRIGEYRQDNKSPSPLVHACSWRAANSRAGSRKSGYIAAWSHACVVAPTSRRVSMPSGPTSAQVAMARSERCPRSAVSGQKTPSTSKYMASRVNSSRETPNHCRRRSNPAVSR
jgi:hypothetical protein